MDLDDRFLTITFDASDPERIVSIFEDCCGDIDEFIRIHHASERTKIKLLFQVEIVLNRPENTEFRERWDAAARAFHKTRLTLAKREALDRIKAMQGQRVTTKNMRDQMNYAKFILQDLMSAEVHKAKKNVDKQLKKEDEGAEEDDFFATKTQKLVNST